MAAFRRLLAALNIIYRHTCMCRHKQTMASTSRHSIYSIIHSGYFYIASSGPLLFRSAPDTAWIMCRSFTPKRQRQLRVKDLPNVSTWRLERDSNPQPIGRKASSLPMSHHGPLSASIPKALRPFVHS